MVWRADLEKNITFFRGFDAYREKDRASAGSTNAEITVPFFDVLHDIGCNGNMGSF